MASIERIKASDGSGNANVATVQNARSGGASTIVVDTVTGFNAAGFDGTMGTPHTFTDPVTGEEITIISEETAVDFTGHVDGGNLEIDTIAPGYTDAGSEVGDIVIVRPTTQWADNVAEVLEVSHNDDGTLKVADAGAIDDENGNEQIEFATTGSAVNHTKVTNAATGGTPKIEAAGSDTDVNLQLSGKGAGAVWDGGNLLNTEYFTADGTWTKPEGLAYVIVEVQGGGGGGGGGNPSASQGVFAGGGGGGGYVRAKILAADLGATETVTVGPGGAGSGSTTGASGTASSFGSHCTGNGGGGGNGGVSSAGAGAHWLGGGGGGGSGTYDVLVHGGSGGTGVWVSTANNIGFGGYGGGSHLSGGPTRQTIANAQGDTGRQYGGGGGGAPRAGSGGTGTGGTGAAGIVIVHEYF